MYNIVPMLPSTIETRLKRSIQNDAVTKTIPLAFLHQKVRQIQGYRGNTARTSQKTSAHQANHRHELL